MRFVFWLRQEPKESHCLSVCPTVRPFGDKLSRAVNLHLSKSESNGAIREQSESTKRALREQSESTQSIQIRVIQSEPKILRLVNISNVIMNDLFLNLIEHEKFDYECYECINKASI